jgi:hypothetical protein
VPNMLSQGVAHDPTGTGAGRIRDAIAFPDGVVRLLQAVFESKSLGALGALLRLVEVLAKGRVLDAAVSRRWAATAAQLDNFFALVKTMGCFSSAAWRGLNKMWVVITARLGIESAGGGALPSLAAVRDIVKRALQNYDMRLLGINHGDRGISDTAASPAARRRGAAAGRKSRDSSAPRRAGRIAGAPARCWRREQRSRTSLNA